MSQQGVIPQLRRSECYVAVIGDEDTVVGMLLAGFGSVDASRESNFYVTDTKTTAQDIEDAFRRFTTRPDIAVVLITQPAAEQIRHLVSEYDKAIPTILEIPSKDSPYDPSKDSIYQRLKRMTGGD